MGLGNLVKFSLAIGIGDVLVGELGGSGVLIEGGLEGGCMVF